MREKSEKPDEKLEGKTGPVMEIHMDANRTLSQLSYRPIFNYFGDCGAHCFSNMPICLCYMTMQ